MEDGQKGKRLEVSSYLGGYCKFKPQVMETNQGFESRNRKEKKDILFSRHILNIYSKDIF